MPMLNRQQAGQFLERIGFVQRAQNVWIAQQMVEGRLFIVEAFLKEAVVEIRIALNLFTRCNQTSVYRYFNEENTRIALGKFAIGPEVDHEGRLLFLSVEMPPGTEEEYIAEESLVLLIGLALNLLKEHYTPIERLFRQGCEAPGEVHGERVRELLERMRVFGREEGGHA